MSYIGNTAISRDFLTSVQQEKEKILETSRYAGNNFDERQHDITMKKLIGTALRSIKISNYITNKIHNCQTTLGFGGNAIY